MKESILYAILTIFVIVPIEYWRILRIKNIKGNVNHKVSFLIGFSAYLILLTIFKIWGWETVTFAFVCGSIRGLFYDPFLNIFLRNKIEYQSVKSDNKTDSWEVKLLGQSFWNHRIFYFLLLIFSLILYTRIS